MRKLTRADWMLALCIALFPPIWAVFSPFIGIKVGAVALICAGVYVAGGDDVKNGIKMSLGFLMGDLWAVLVVLFTDMIPGNPNVVTFILLFIGGGLAVVISALFPKAFYLPSWLCGWAIGVVIMAPGGSAAMGTMPIQIGVSMLMGVWYVGTFIHIVHNKIK